MIETCAQNRVQHSTVYDLYLMLCFQNLCKGANRLLLRCQIYTQRDWVTYQDIRGVVMI